MGILPYMGCSHWVAVSRLGIAAHTLSMYCDATLELRVTVTRLGELRTVDIARRERTLLAQFGIKWMAGRYCWTCGTGQALGILQQRWYMRLISRRECSSWLPSQARQR